MEELPVMIQEAGAESATRWRQTTAIGSQGDQLDSEDRASHGDTQLPHSCDYQPAECEVVGTRLLGAPL